MANNVFKELLDEIEENIDEELEKLHGTDVPVETPLNLGGNWFNNPDGVGKYVGKGKKLYLTNKGILYFHVEITNNPVNAPVITIKLGDKLYSDVQENIVRIWHNTGIIESKQTGNSILNMLKRYNDITTDKYSVSTNGGYLNLEEIKDSKPEWNVSETVLKFLHSMNESQLYAFKELLVLPFANIIREKAIRSRGLVKCIVLSGDKYSGKTLLVNFVRNMFTHDKINFDSGGTPQSAVALRNSLANTIGIVMCDEADAKLINKKRGSFKDDVEGILKGIYQKELPKTSDLNNQGHLLPQTQIGVPVFTMNDDIILTEALKDRVISIDFKNCPVLPLIDLEVLKDSLVNFGECIAYVFKETWEYIRMMEDSSQIADYLLNGLEDYFEQDFKFITSVKLLEQEENSSNIIDNTREYLIRVLSYDMRGTITLETALLDNWEKIDWIEQYDINKVIINQSKFNKFIKSKECLNDRGISSQRIKQRLKMEIGEIWEEKQVRRNRKNFIGHIYDYYEFIGAFEIQKTIKEV